MGKNTYTIPAYNVVVVNKKQNQLTDMHNQSNYIFRRKKKLTELKNAFHKKCNHGEQIIR